MKKTEGYVRGDIDIGEEKRIKILLRIEDLRAHLEDSKELTVSLQTKEQKKLM